LNHSIFSPSGGRQVDWSGTSGFFGWVYQGICHRPVWPCAIGVHGRMTSRHSPSGGRHCETVRHRLRRSHTSCRCEVVGRVLSVVSNSPLRWWVGRPDCLFHGSISPSGASGSAPRVHCWMCPIPLRVHLLGSAREPGLRGSHLRVRSGSVFGQALGSRLPAGDGSLGLRIWLPGSSRESGEAFAGLRAGEHQARFVLAVFNAGFTPAACRGWLLSVDIFGWRLSETNINCTTNVAVIIYGGQSRSYAEGGAEPIGLDRGSWNHTSGGSVRLGQALRLRLRYPIRSSRWVFGQRVLER
jgi:hypothetical protein